MRIGKNTSHVGQSEACSRLRTFITIWRRPRHVRAGSIQCVTKCRAKMKPMIIQSA